MVFQIALCDADPALCARLQHLCMEYFARRADQCVVHRLAQDQCLAARPAGGWYQLYIIGLSAVAQPPGLQTAALLRAQGCRSPIAFVARNRAHAYEAFRVDAMQYLLLPLHPGQLFALLGRAAEPEYGPALVLPTAGGLRALPYRCIEYVECTQHVLHVCLTNGEQVASLSQRKSFAQLIAPLLADPRFVQPHRSYLANLAEVQQVAAGELLMNSGARVPVPRSRQGEVRSAWLRWFGAEDTAGGQI